MILALDVGGTKLAGCVAPSADAAPAAERRVPTPPSGETALAVLLALADALAAEAGGVAGIGVSFGGHVGPGGAIRRSLQVPGWEDVPLAALLRERFAAPVSVANDADAGALGEWDAAGRPYGAPVCYVTVSTGVGGGIALDGDVVAGIDGLAGEVGHLVVDPGGDPCGCGRRGCVETVASGPAIERRAAAVGFVATAADVTAAAAAGPPLWEPLRAELALLAWPDATTVVRPPLCPDPPLRGALVLGARAHSPRDRGEVSSA